MRLQATCLIAGLFWFGATDAMAAAAAGRTLLVRDLAEYRQASAELQPGDTVVLANGTWRDARLLFQGQGRAGRPIRLTAQTPGQVVLSGQSDLRMAGEYLEVSHLVFRDGWAPGGEAVSFRASREQRANHSRVTGVVIDHYNKPDRGEADHWVALYGHDNRFDHSQLLGKTNRGTTLVVIRDAEQGLDNRHLIDHNWFGPRPSLGANGGETIRVGTSQDSLSDSHTRVEDNWFEGCDGEVEIVSNKSGGNVYRGNVFFHSRGALVLRHGSGNRVERNVFLGGGKPHTGGVRIINGRQTVRENYFEDLAGENFGAALSVMYGTVGAPKHRYAPVEHALIERNTWIAPRQLLLGAGKDDERNAAPSDSRFASNLIVNGASDPLQVQGDIGGIAFTDNVQSPVRSPGFAVAGVAGREIAMQRAATGLLTPTAPLGGVGAPADLQPIARQDVGVDWYPKAAAEAPSSALRAPSLQQREGTAEGVVQEVAPGDDTLTRAVHAAAPGAHLRLREGRYAVNEVLVVTRPLMIEGPAAANALVQSSRPILFDLHAGGTLQLKRLTVDGNQMPDEAGNALIRIAPGSEAANYAIVIEDSRLQHLDGNRRFDVVATGKGTLADLIALRRVQVSDVSGQVIAAAAEVDDGGTYNAERVEITDSTFARIGGAVADLYRGGTDESTFGPAIEITGSQFEQVGHDGDAALRLRGVQYARLAGNRFHDSAPVRFSHSVGTPTLLSTDNQSDRASFLVSDITAKASP